MKKAGRDVLLALVALMTAAGLFFWSRQTSPEQLSQALFDLHLPTRMVLLADGDAPRLAAVDLMGYAVQLVPLQVRARFMAVDASRGVLAYGQDGAGVLRDLSTHHERSFAVPHGVRGAWFVPQSGDLWVWGDDGLSVADVQGRLRHTTAGFSRVHGVHFAPLISQVVVLADGEVANVSLQGEVLQRRALPPGWTVATPSALSPDGNFLLFGVRDGRGAAGVVWQMDGSWQVFPMTAPLLRPIADNAARQLFFVAEDGQGVRVAAGDMLHAERFATLPRATHVALGWLDSRLLVTGGGRGYVHDAQSFELLHDIALPAAVEAVFVSADSKTALLTLKDENALFLLDFRTGALQSAVLPQGVRPTLVTMGAAYTLCH